MLVLPISKSWIISRTAQKTYLACALLSLALIATLLGTRMATSATGTAYLNSSAAQLLGIVLLPEILGMATLWVAMWYFWFSYDNSNWVKKAAWFVPLYLLAPIGVIAY
jgi:hypothetical protein